MVLTNNILKEILNKSNSICCLCLDGTRAEPVKFQDEILLETDAHNTQEVSNIIQFLLRDIVNNNAFVSNVVCDDCIKSATTSYKFIKKCSKIVLEVSTMMKNLLQSLNDVDDIKLYKAKYLFVATDVESCQSKVYYDHKRSSVHTTSAKLKRFLSLVTNGKEKMKNKHTTIDENLSCVQCGVICGSKYNLKRHVWFHCKKTIMHSDYVFESNSDIQIKCESIDKNIIGVKNFKCAHCDKIWNTENCLKAHQLKHQTIVCSKCGKVVRADRIKEHESIHLRKFVCSRCGKVYKTHKAYVHHTKDIECFKNGERVKIPKILSCDICKKKYGSKTSLLVHIRLQHSAESRHKCTWCNKPFLNYSTLKSHIVTHTQEKNFKCKLCGGKFVTKPSLLYHSRLHTGEKPYKCKFCEQTFLSSSRRADHVRVYHKTASLECQMCSKKFNSYSVLHQHRKRHYNPKSSLYIGTICPENVTIK